MLKTHQARLQQYVNWDLPDFQAGFRKGRGTRDQISNIHWIIEKAREFQKKSPCAWLTMLKPLTVCITTNCGKFIKRWEYQTTLPASWETCMQVKKQQLQPDMEQHHRLNGHKFEQAAGDGKGQGSPACCSPWGHRVRQDWATERTDYILENDIPSLLGTISRLLL